MVLPEPHPPRKLWDTACLDWQERIREHRSLLPVLPLVDAQARRAVAIFDRLRLPDVPGQPLLRDAGAGWFREIVAAVFGSWDARTKERYLREFFVMVPKKNAKTTYGAALMVVALLMNVRPRAEFLFIAPTHEIAELAFSQAVGMIEADAVLAAKTIIQGHNAKRITYRPTGAFLKVKSFDPKVVTGAKPAGLLLDELHVIAEAPEADRVIGQLRGGLVSQPEGFMFTITTQSERPPAGVFKAELTKARMVRDGLLKAAILPVIYEFPEGVDWRNPDNWTMVTPNEGRSVRAARLWPDYEAAIAAGEGELRRWASQHLNIQVGMQLQDDAWPGAKFWDGCVNPELRDLEYLLAMCDCFAIGIDAGGPEDWMGLCVLGRTRDGPRAWMAWTHAWVHDSALDKYKNEAAKWRDFEREGTLSIVPAIGPDVDEVVALVTRVYETGQLVRVGMDPAGGAKVLREALMMDAGLPQELFAGIGQGWHLLGVMRLVERYLASHRLLHAGSALMNYCVGNARVEFRSNAAFLTKAASKGKIDALMALLDAAECLALAPQPVNPDAMIAPA